MSTTINPSQLQNALHILNQIDSLPDNQTASSSSATTTSVINYPRQGVFKAVDHVFFIQEENDSQSPTTHLDARTGSLTSTE